MAKRRKPPEVPDTAVPEGMDKQELAERTEAADAYAGENPDHFVRYLDDCTNLSINAMTDIRDEQDECWRVFNEEEPYNFAWKEPWQSRVIVPKPFSNGQHGMAMIRKAFEMEFLSVENEQNQEAAEFWKKLMMIQLSRNFANFPINFSDAAGMSLVVGQSMEMIPQWMPGKGLYFDLIEPWKIHRDPDSLSRKPQSGMYWIHQEYLPLYQLKEAEKAGRYENTDDLGPGSTKSRDPNASEEEIARRRNMYHTRGDFQASVLTSEFWGTVLSPRYEMLLPDATYTVAADRVISPPRPAHYPTLRWPGVSFSALPHLLRFGGRGLVQGIKSLWYLMCNLMSLHADNLNWVVNPMLEIDVYSLIDQSDVDVYPGKTTLTKSTVQGQHVMRPVDMRSQTTDILANMNKADMMLQEGMMLNYAAAGLPGYRAEVTAREAAQNLEQSLTVVGAMGKNLEDGALDVIMAAAETIMVNMTYAELVKFMGQEVANQYRDASTPTGLRLPELTTGTFRVSGISALMRDQEILKNIVNFFPLFDKPIFTAYLEPYGFIKAWVKRAGLQDEGVMVSEEKAQQIAAAQQQQQDEQIQKQRQEEAAKAALPGMEADKHAAQADKFRAEAALRGGEAAMQGGNVVPMPTRQFGGPVDPNQPYMVGEQGPEVFVPQVPGTIVPPPVPFRDEEIP